MLLITKHKTKFLILSLLLVIVSATSIFVFGFKQGIDFSGGALWRIHIGSESSPEEIAEIISGATQLSDADVSYDRESGSAIMKLPPIGEAEHQALLAVFSNKFAGFEEQSFDSIGPSVGAELRKNSLKAIIFVLLGISFYVAFAFRKVYKPVSSWKYALITLATLGHDVLIASGFLTILGRLRGVEIDSNFVVALLVIAGFSVHDTIVVFDRIRENLMRKRGGEFGEVVDESVNQVIVRSINTSLTLILVLLALLFAGPETLKYFTLTLLVGTFVGVYSSIFVASPILYLWQRKR